jgi:hypothetical protein
MFKAQAQIEKDGADNFEYLSESEAQMSPRDNDNQPVEEILVDGKVVWRDYPSAGDQRIAQRFDPALVGESRFEIQEYSMGGWVRLTVDDKLVEAFRAEHKDYKYA